MPAHSTEGRRKRPEPVVTVTVHYANDEGWEERLLRAMRPLVKEWRESEAPAPEAAPADRTP